MMRAVKKRQYAAARTSLESSCGMLGFGDGFFAGAFPLPFDFDF